MKLTVSEKYLFCTQIAMILKSGFSLQQGIEMIYQECDNQNLKSVLHKLQAALEEQLSFYQALDQCEAFDDYMSNLVAIGETSGNLDAVMESLSQYYFRIDDISSKLKQALTFPLILIVMMFVVVSIIVFKVLPIFRNVLLNLGTDLSSFATTFMQFGQVFSFICLIILGFIVIGLLGIYLYQKTKQEDVLTTLVQKAFFTKKLSQALNKAQITYGLSLFISSGYDLNQAMEYIPKLVVDTSLRDSLTKCFQDLNTGDSFVEVIKRYQIYQGMPLNMIQIGFKTGQLDETMVKLSDYFQNQVSEAIDHFLNIIEPSIVALLSLIVGIVLISVMLPLISIMASI